MIIRKPYAFLIKHFRRIHIFVLLLCGYVYYKCMQTRSFVADFLELGTYDAYNEPITRVEVDEIRGVGSAHLVRKLLMKNLIEERGKSDLPGRPMMYGTTKEFLDFFGLKRKEDLPTLDSQIEVIDLEPELFDSKYHEKDSIS